MFLLMKRLQNKITRICNHSWECGGGYCRRAASRKNNHFRTFSFTKKTESDSAKPCNTLFVDDNICFLLLVIHSMKMIQKILLSQSQCVKAAAGKGVGFRTTPWGRQRWWLGWLNLLHFICVSSVIFCRLLPTSQSDHPSPFFFSKSIICSEFCSWSLKIAYLCIPFYHVLSKKKTHSN